MSWWVVLWVATNSRLFQVIYFSCWHILPRVVYAAIPANAVLVLAVCVLEHLNFIILDRFSAVCAVNLGTVFNVSQERLGIGIALLFQPH